MRDQISYLFIGLGGAGQRHLRITRDLYPKSKVYIFRPKGCSPTLNPDFTIDESLSIAGKHNATLIRSLSNIPSDITHVVISTPPSTHSSYVSFFLSQGMHVLCEKPSFSTSSQHRQVEESLQTSTGSLMLMFQRMHHPFSRRIAEVLKSRIGELSSISVSVRSFCPSWHPYQDYRQLYATQQSLGGGPVLTECHELYMILSLLGLPDSHVYRPIHSTEWASDCPIASEIRLNYDGYSVSLYLGIFEPYLERSVTLDFIDRSTITYDYLNSTSSDPVQASPMLPLHQLDELCYREKHQSFRQACSCSVDLSSYSIFGFITNLTGS